MDESLGLEIPRLREDRLRRAMTHLWQAVRDLGADGPDMERARALLIELQEEPWPSA
jgi:hypothetical protein